MSRSAILLILCTLLAGCSGDAATPTVTPHQAEQPLDGATINDLSNRLRSDEYLTQLEAIWTAGALGPKAKPVLPVVIELLKDRNRLVREEAALCLSYVDPSGDDVLVPLILSTRDESPFVRCKAARSLERLGPRASPSVNDLIHLLNDDVTQVRHAAARALGAIGPRAFPARAHLVAMAQDEYEDPGVRAIARDSIKWIDTK